MSLNETCPPPRPSPRPSLLLPSPLPSPELVILLPSGSCVATTPTLIHKNRVFNTATAIPIMRERLGAGRRHTSPSPSRWGANKEIIINCFSYCCTRIRHVRLPLSPSLSRSLFFLHWKVILLWRWHQVHGVTSHTPNRELTSITLWNFGFHHFLIFLKGSQHLALTAVVHLESNLKTEKKANDILLSQPCH